MKKFFSFILISALALATWTACVEDQHEDPNTDHYLVTSPVSLGRTNTTIGELKSRYSSYMTQSNAFVKVEEDLIFEGVVVANDISGNLYQTLMLRDGDDAIVLGVKNTCLYPYFAFGQCIKVNLKGLYIGNYSKTPKIGQPYQTSAGNWRLGPMLFPLLAENVEIIGRPDTTYAECIPVEPTVDWLKSSSNQNYQNAPMLVTVEGVFTEADGKATFAPDELKDAGYGVDRSFKVGTSTTVTITVRTSTQNEISYEVLPQGQVRLTGMLTYYSGWQLQLRSLDDIEVLE